jgi:hypothetical protein
MQIGSRVVRVGNPEIVGRIVDLRTDRAKVKWSPHTTTWANRRTLILTKPQLL